MKRIPFATAFIFLLSLQSFSQGGEAGTDLGAIKQYMKDRDTNTISQKARYIEAVKSVLKQYNTAIEKLYLSGTDDLFTTDPEIYESGTNDGTYSHYRQSHLNPELAELKTIKFTDYKVSVMITGKYASATETYDYLLTTKNNMELKGNSITTSVLKKIKGEWKIMICHNSSAQ